MFDNLGHTMNIEIMVSIPIIIKLIAYINIKRFQMLLFSKSLYY